MSARAPSAQEPASDRGHLRAARAERDAAIRARDEQARAFAEVREQLRREIAQREQANRALAQQRSVLEHILDTVPYSVFWKDRQSVYRGANRKKLHALGFSSPEELVGKTDYDTGVSQENADFYREIDRRVMEEGKPILDLEETQLRADGPHVLLTSKVPLHDECGTVSGILGIYVDITERKRMETELGRAKEAAEAAAREHSEFLAAISHELRTPLTLILGPLEELLAQDEQPPDTHAQLERIRRNACRLYSLVNDILDFTKVEEGKMPLRWSAVDVTASVAAAVDDARSIAELKDIELAFDAAPGLGPVALDRDKLEKIVLNLLGNALKFTPAGGRIEVLLRALPGEVELAVADTGPGIPPEKQRRIFERFQQIDGPINRRTPGSGLGLALVKEMAALMGGKVSVDSAPGSGACFRVTLPRDPGRLRALEAGPAPAAEPGKAAQFERLATLFQVAHTEGAPAAAGVAPVERTRVLVAEDDPEMRAYMREVLADRWDVVTVDNGRRALEAIAQTRPFVIVTDVMMPEMDGLELVARLKSDPGLRHVPVILVTAKASREEVVGGLDAGADDYLSKPFGPAELRARVEAAVRQRRMFEEVESKRRELGDALARLHETQDEMVQVAKMAAVGTLAAGMSHELNNPLATILMASQRLLRKLPPDSPWRQTMAAIERQALRSSRLVTLLLDFSRRRPASCEPVNLGGLLDNVAELARSQVRGGDVTLVLEPPGPELPSVQGSAQQLEVALLNLVKNALDAMNGPGSVRIAAQCRALEGNEGVEIAVSDTGAGMSADVLAQIFDPFFTTKPPGKGTGLGLSLALRIVESHGGRLRGESELGRGTTMHVWLPAAHTPRALQPGEIEKIWGP